MCHSLNIHRSNYVASIFPALERPEGASQQDCVAMEDFQQRTNAVSLEKVKAYYRRLRYLFYSTLPLFTGFPGTEDVFHLKGRVHPLVLHNKQKLHFVYYILESKAFKVRT